MDDSKQWNRQSNKNNKIKKKPNWKWKLSNLINNNANLIKIPNETIIISIIVLCWFSEIYRRFVYAVRIKENHSKWKRFSINAKVEKFNSNTVQTYKMISADRCSFIHIGHAWRYIAHIFIRIPYRYMYIFFPRSIYTLIEIEYRYEVQKSQKKGQYTGRWGSHWLSGYILTLRLVTMVQVHCILILHFVKFL